jgi:hypothetical protein
VDVRDNVGVSSVTATITGPNESMTVVPLSLANGNTYRGVFTAPANTGAEPAVYSARVAATDARGNRTTESCGDITVSPDTDGPVIVRCEVTPRALPASGGQIRFSVAVRDNVGVSSVTAIVTPPKGTPVEVALTPGTSAPGSPVTYTGTFDVPANSSTSAQEYAVSVRATDPSGNATSESCGTVRVSPPVQPGPGALKVSPKSLIFGRVILGRRATRTLVIRNTHGAGGPRIAGTISQLAPPFRVLRPAGGPLLGVRPAGEGTPAEPIPFDLGPGEEQVVTVVFAPKALGQYRQLLVVSPTDSSNGAVSVRVSGRGCRLVRRR